MPATSKKQYRAMRAAAAGNSTLGIPQSVGEDFASATPSPGQLPEQAPPMDMTKLVSKKKKKSS